MSSANVLLVTDRPGFEAEWAPAFAHFDLEASVAKPSSFSATTQRGRAIVFDAEATRYVDDEEELLSAVGFARALGAYVAVQRPVDADESDGLLEEMCAGLVAHAKNDVSRICQVVARKLDADRAYRFEFVTLSPRADEILAILGDGRSALLSRPVNGEDDGSSITRMEIIDDARGVSLGFESGAELLLNAADITRRIREGDDGNGHIPVDGQRLGKRIRELRLEAGLTQAELARRTGIHRPNIARVEAGRHTPSLETIARLATAIGVPTARVLHKG